MQNNQYVDIDNAREEEQRKIMRDIIAADHCPFCMENFKKYNDQPILKEGKYWLLTTNKWPYENTKIHLLLIYKNHAVNLAQLDPESGKELIEFVQWIEKKHQIPGGGWSMRFGDTNYSAGTVNHLHIQFIQPNVESPDFKPVRIKLGKG